MPEISYALMREGNSDIALQILVERYARQHGVTLVFNEGLSQPFRTGLGKYTLKIRTKSNFETGAVDAAFYFTDKDNSEGFTKLDKIQNVIESVNPAYVTKSIIGIPDPHMEAWLIADENAIKALFQLPGEEALPYPEHADNPKARLSAIANTFGGPELAPPLARQKLAESCDLQVLAQRSQSFNQFSSRFNAYLNTLAGTSAGA